MLTLKENEYLQVSFEVEDGAFSFLDERILANPSERKAKLITTLGMDQPTVEGIINGKRRPLNFQVTTGSRSYQSILQSLNREIAKISSTHPEIFKELRTKAELVANDNQETGKAIETIVELFKDDFTFKRTLNRKVDLSGGKALNLQRKIEIKSGEHQEFISGFLTLELESPQEVLTESSTLPSIEERRSVIQSSLSISGRPQTEVKQQLVLVEAMLKIDSKCLEWGDLNFWWGGQDDLPSQWKAEPIRTEEIERLGNNSIHLRRIVRCETPGHYGITIFFEDRETQERFWVGQPRNQDGQFFIPPLPGTRKNVSSENLDLGISTDNFEQIRDAAKAYPERVSKALGQADAELVKNLYHLALQNEDASELVSCFNNLGINEIALISPEGPHAIAGGLAQVIVGLMNSLTANGIAVTLITPLYEESQGSKHAGAERLLFDGIRLRGRSIAIEEAGEIDVHIGPTKYSGNGWTRSFPFTAKSRVYVAQDGLAKVVFFRNGHFTNRLYPHLSQEDQLKRVAYTSRAALELLKKSDLSLDPAILITNDWLTGLVPVLLKTDASYAQLNQIKSIHLFHNAGRDYQGIIPTHGHYADLWPMLNISG